MVNSSLLSINNYYYRRGGAEAVFLDHNAIFESRGWQVVTFAMQHQDNIASPWKDYYVEEIELGRNYGTAEKIRKAIKSVYSFEAKHRIGDLVDATRPDLAHCHNIYHHISPSILGELKSKGLPVVITLHDLKIACPAYRMLSPEGICEQCKGGRIDNIIWNRCIHGSKAASSIVFVEALLHKLLNSYQRHVDIFVVPSQFYIEKFVEWGWDRDRFQHIPNFVDCSTFVPQFDPGKGFVYFGRLSREKGIATLIQAAIAAGVELDIVGMGPLEQEMSELIGANSDQIRLRGYQSGKDLYDIVRNARAVVLPSEWYENAPISILEAYALGKPVIGSNIGGIPEMVLEGETGITYEACSTESLTSALSSMRAKTAHEIITMGKSARHFAETRFSTTAYYSRCTDMYQKLLLG